MTSAASGDKTRSHKYVKSELELKNMAGPHKYAKSELELKNMAGPHKYAKSELELKNIAGLRHKSYIVSRPLRFQPTGGLIPIYIISTA